MASNCEIVMPCEIADGWRNLHFFRDVVSQDLNHVEGNFSLCNLTVTNATDKQAGFTSSLHRIRVDIELTDGKRMQKSYIIKEGSMEDEFNYFLKETIAYQELIPAFEKLFHCGVRFGPKLYKSVATSFKVMVMEDLIDSGFKMRSCSNRLDVLQSEAVLSKLAKFHAASAVHCDQAGPYSAPFKKGMFDQSTTKCDDYIVKLFNSFLVSLKERNCSGRYIDLISQWGSLHPYVVGDILFMPSSDEFNVLNHGDLWMHNIMFRDNDHLMIDYQISFYGSFSFDVIQFILCSVNVDDIIAKFNELIIYYHRELEKAFQALKKSYMLPSQEKLHAEINKHGFFAGLLMIEAIPLFCHIENEELNLGLIGSAEPEGEELRRTLFHNEKFIDVVDRLLPFLYERGYLRCPIGLSKVK